MAARTAGSGRVEGQVGVGGVAEVVLFWSGDQTLVTVQAIYGLTDRFSISGGVPFVHDFDYGATGHFPEVEAHWQIGPARDAAGHPERGISATWMAGLGATDLEDAITVGDGGERVGAVTLGAQVGAVTGWTVPLGDVAFLRPHLALKLSLPVCCIPEPCSQDGGHPRTWLPAAGLTLRRPTTTHGEWLVGVEGFGFHDHTWISGVGALLSAGYLFP